MFFLPENVLNFQTQKLLALLVITIEDSVLFTYHVVLIGSNIPAVFEEINPGLRISLGLANHHHLLSSPPLQNPFRMNQNLRGVFSSSSSCERFKCFFIFQFSLLPLTVSSIECQSSEDLLNATQL